MHSLKIGIVSGMGAAAGARMLNLLISECQRRGAKQDSDFPEIVLHNVPSRGLDNTGVADFTMLRIELFASIALLNRCGMDVIMIACNTAHLYYRELQEISRAKILNMVDIAAEGLSGRTVAVLSSRTTRDTGLYAAALTKQGAKFVIETDDETQNFVDMIIGSAIEGNAGILYRSMLKEIIGKMKEKSDAVILGCTELPVVFNEGCIDPVEKIVAKVLSK